MGKHSNIPPEEPTKPVKDSIECKIEKLIKKTNATAIEIHRPPFDSAMTTLTPMLATSAKQLLKPNQNCSADNKNANDNFVEVGTPCKNNGCRATYENEFSNDTACVHHSGSPIFHEGLKYWSCCLRKTTDFQTFLNQEGCAKGNHLWHKKVGIYLTYLVVLLFTRGWCTGEQGECGMSLGLAPDGERGGHLHLQ